MREVVNGLMYVLSTGCQWRAIPKDLPPKARSTTILICGPMTAHCSASTTRFMTSVVNKRNGKPVRLPPSSTARASRAPKRGASHRSGVGYDAGKEDQGQEAACSRRYIRPAASRCCPSCQRPRSRWSHSRHGDPVRDVSPFFKSCSLTVAIRGRIVSTALAKVRPHLNVEIVKRSDRAKGFVVLSKRWIVVANSCGTSSFLVASVLDKEKPVWTNDAAFNGDVMRELPGVCGEADRQL